MRRLVRLVVLSLFVSACETDFELQSELRRTRVLGIRAEPAGVAIPESRDAFPPPVTLTALAVSPAGEVAVRYALCPLGDPYAPTLDCPGEDGLELPDGVLDVARPEVLELLFGDAGVDLANPELDAALVQGLPLFVGYEARDGQEGPPGVERGIRRIHVRITDQPNRNPDLSDVLGNGEPLGSRPLSPGEELSLEPWLAEGSVEEPGAPGPAAEQVFYSWHATGEGELESFRSQEGEGSLRTSSYRAPSEPGPVTFYVVARDGRGGTGWLVRTVEVAE